MSLTCPIIEKLSELWRSLYIWQTKMLQYCDSFGGSVLIFCMPFNTVRPVLRTQSDVTFESRGLLNTCQFTVWNWKILTFKDMWSHTQVTQAWLFYFIWKFTYSIHAHRNQCHLCFVFTCRSVTFTFILAFSKVRWSPPIKSSIYISILCSFCKEGSSQFKRKKIHRIYCLFQHFSGSDY